MIGSTAQGFAVSTQQILVPVDTDFYSMHVRLFEPETRRGTVFCFHGFAGNGLDFGVLGAELARNGYLVVCPDMPGRGQSAYLPSRRYDLPHIVNAAAAALAKYTEDPPALIGMGWGGLIGLLAADRTSTILSRLAIIDLPLDFSIETDAVIARALDEAELVFPTEREAIAHIAAGPEFSGQHEVDVRHRIRPLDGGGYRMAFDASIPRGTRRYGGRVYDLRTLYNSRPTELLLMTGNDGIGTTQIQSYASSRPGTYLARNQGDGSRALLRTPAEVFTILGFLGAADVVQR